MSTLANDCRHVDYDEYSETCPTCGLSGVEIHKSDCGKEAVEIENNTFECEACGFTYFEQMFTTCDYCNAMTIPIEDDSFDGICTSCGKDAFA